MSPLRIAAALVPLVCYALVTEKAKLAANDHFYVHVLLLHGVIMLASSGSAYIARFAVYTGVFLCLAIPRLVTAKDPRTRTIMALLFIMFYGSSVRRDSRDPRGRQLPLRLRQDPRL